MSKSLAQGARALAKVGLGVRRHHGEAQARRPVGDGRRPDRLSEHAARKITQIYEGTNEIQRIVIARAMS